MASITETCAKCGKQFLIIDQEQAFLQQKNLPLPKICPTDRQLRRLRLRGGRQLFKTKCQKCDKDIVVSYEPAKQEQPIYCKEDYEKFFMENDPLVTDPLPNI
jgi:CxxC-x17-CxxC domain-containing protein